MCRPFLALALSANVRCTEQPIVLARVSSRLSSAVPNRCCRRNRERPDPTPSHNPNNAAEPVPPHPMRTGQDDTRTSWNERRVRSLVPASPSPPSEQSDPRPSECPAFFPLHRPSVSSPFGPAVESNCPTTSDSRACRGYLSDAPQTPQSTVRRLLLLLDLLLPVDTRPRLPAWKSRTVLPHSSAPPLSG